MEETSEPSHIGGHTNDLQLKRSSKTARPNAPSTAAAASSSFQHKSKPASVPVRILCALALVPTLYGIHQLVVQPLGRALGHGLLRLAPPARTGADLVVGHLAKREVEKGTAEFAVFAALIPILVILSGIFAGLTLGYMSLDMTQLEILSTAGNDKQKAYAKAIMPVRRKGHQLLTTLLLVNMIVNESLPVIADPVLGGGVQAVVVSTVLIVIFAEIIPQSICSRYGLLVGAKSAKMTQVLIYIMWPIAWPVSLLLERLLGNHNGIIYRKGELRELLNLHAQSGVHGGDLAHGTVIITQGALDLQDKVVRDAMTPIDRVFMLEDTTKLDYEVLLKVVQSGHSRIPVFKYVEVPDLVSVGKTRTIKHILGTFLVKNCVLLDPEDATPILSIPMNTTFPSVPQDEPLLNMLSAFREGRSHMALVSRRSRRIVDVGLDNLDEESVMTAAALGLRERIKRKLARSDSSSGSSSEDEDLEMGQVRKKTREQVRKETKKEGQGVPGDAFIDSNQLNDLMEAYDGESVGIITLEDVLEELIGDEIEDEYDQRDEETGNAVQAFIPQEAQQFVENAQKNRLLASSLSSQEQPPNEKAAATSDPAPAPKTKTVAGAFVSKLGAGMGVIGRRTSSAPGRKRNPEDQLDVALAFPTSKAPSSSPSPAITPATSGEGTLDGGETVVIGAAEPDAAAVVSAPGNIAPVLVEEPVSILHSEEPSSTTSAPGSQPGSTVVPPHAALATAIDRGRLASRTPLPGAPGITTLQFASPRATSVAALGGGGASVPSTPIGNGPPGGLFPKKKTFKSQPTTQGAVPTLARPKTFDDATNPSKE